MKLHSTLLIFQFIAIATMNNIVAYSETSRNDSSPIEPKQDEKVNGSKLDGSVRSKRKVTDFLTTKNNGLCCTSDNVPHDLCVVSTGYSNGLPAQPGAIPAFEVNFTISECETRCLNDAMCKGYSISTTTTLNAVDSTTASYDTCVLYTTTQVTDICMLNRPETSTGQLDPSAECKDKSVYPPEITMNYHEGCRIKIEFESVEGPPPPPQSPPPPPQVPEDKPIEGCQCKEMNKCEKSTEFFKGEWYCAVSKDSTCPDLTTYSYGSQNYVSAEACKEIPNSYGFIRHEDKICDYNAGNSSKSFRTVDESMKSYIHARGECENYCYDTDHCWGCTLNCEKHCNWIAITECNEIRLVESEKGGLAQKPVCFDIKTTYGESKVLGFETWKLGTCSTSISSEFTAFHEPYESFSQKCCLAPDNYILECYDEKVNDGWNGGSIEILGHTYCDDFVDESVRRKIKIPATSLPEKPDNTGIITNEYINAHGQKCNRLDSKSYSKDEAKNKCSSNQHCIGFINTRYVPFPTIDGIIPEDRSKFRLCLNKNLPFIDVEANSQGKQISIFKKKDLDSAPKINMVPKAKMLSNSGRQYYVPSDYSCPNGAKKYQLNPSDNTYDPLIEVFVTCHCEDHCSWNKCRLENPPSNCLDGVNSSWQWDEKRKYWVAQMKHHNSSMDTNIDETAAKEDGETSIPVEPENGNFDDSNLNSSSFECYEKVTILVLCLIFFLAVFAYFGRAPRKILSNKEFLSNSLKRIFNVLCALCAIYMIMTQVVKYFENNDASSIHYKEFNKFKNNRYPTFSICFEGESFHYKNFEDQFYKLVGMNRIQYGSILKGESSFITEYDPTKKLYNKMPRDFRSVAHIDFNEWAYNLSEVISGLDLVAYNHNQTKQYRDVATDIGLLKFPFKLTYQTWKERCFTRISNDQQGQQRSYDFLSLKAKTLATKRFEDTEFKLIIHYPGQMIRSMHKPALTATFKDLDGLIKKMEAEDFGVGSAVRVLKLREIFIQQITVLKMRKNSNQPCNDQLLDDDTKLIDEVVKKARCIPIYFKSLTSMNSKYEECQTQEQLGFVYHLLNRYKDTLLSYDPPCTDMQISVRDQQNKPLKNQNKEIDIKLVYNEGRYQEIVNTRDFGMDTFWISVGGFVGLFLGYSLSQIPELLASIPSLFRKRKEGF